MQVLHAMGNQLADVPRDLTRSSSLEDVNVADNALRGLPSGWGGMPALRSLVLYGNRLTSLPGDLAAAPSLRSLWLEGNPLKVRAACHAAEAPPGASTRFAARRCITHHRNGAAA